MIQAFGYMTITNLIPISYAAGLIGYLPSNTGAVTKTLIKISVRLTRDKTENEANSDTISSENYKGHATSRDVVISPGKNRNTMGWTSSDLYCLTLS